MSTPEQNIAALTELYLNIGPGIDHMMKYCRKHMTEDVVWYNLGLPTTYSLDEAEANIRMFKESMGFDSNYVLIWRNMWGYDNKVFFERKGCFRDEDGETLLVWDVFGVYEFNEEGKIFAARDYYDCSEAYKVIAKNFGEEALKDVKAAAVHPLTEGLDPSA